MPATKESTTSPRFDLLLEITFSQRSWTSSLQQVIISTPWSHDPTFDEYQQRRRGGCSKRKRVESKVENENCIRRDVSRLFSFHFLRKKWIEKDGSIRIWSASLEWSICFEIAEPAAISSSTRVPRWGHFSNGESWRNHRLTRIEGTIAANYFIRTFGGVGQRESSFFGSFFAWIIKNNRERKKEKSSNRKWMGQEFFEME